MAGEAAAENLDSFDLSLNGRDMLPESGAFSDHGIVAGDRIRVHKKLVASSSAPGDIFNQLKFRLEGNCSGAYFSFQIFNLQRTQMDKERTVTPRFQERK